MSENLGLLRVAAVSPALRVADAAFNAAEITAWARKAAAENAAVILFPELCVTGSTCADLFFQERLYRGQLEAIEGIMRDTADIDAAIVIGVYVRDRGRLYDCALLMRRGRPLGVVPKLFIPNSKEFYEARWFASGALAPGGGPLRFMGRDLPFGSLLFRDADSGLSLGIEICEDLWMPVTPGALLALNGAGVILNPSASNDIVGKPAYRRGLVRQASASCVCGYVYASAGVHESTTDLVFGGHGIIAENGTILAESQLFRREGGMAVSEIDIERLDFERGQSPSMADCAGLFAGALPCAAVDIGPLPLLGAGDEPLRTWPKSPFVPDETHIVNERCSEIFSIQTAGLAKRMEHTGAARAVVGVSGGLDSTLALLACAAAMRLLGRPASQLMAVTMPGFGTTGATLENARKLMRLLGADAREIPIADAVTLHFSDIGHDPASRDRTYENAQARERTQILMDLANRENGIAVGTGDLSEAALGWSTYHGDHMSMYGVNASIPKTLVRSVIRWVMDSALSGDPAFGGGGPLRDVLQAILDTPISPELLPPDASGAISQRTEDEIGPYALHDFFLYYTIRYGMRPEKLFFIASRAFAGDFGAESVRGWLELFYRRFFSQQFKRSCMPDGPKVGTVSLSPRGDWRMPSDASVRLWLEGLKA
ncbi:MAG: NAD(+) synthase [Clostridiales Family XIII bacterium]|jgi:NAD+ synthase (glutamine-hydrolysing)|nr:NAD(+) synthase [Clostridiales Family XIII bacterium]